MQQVLDNLKDLPSGTGTKDIDLIFLRGIIESPIVRSLAKVRHIHITHSSNLIILVIKLQLYLRGGTNVTSTQRKCVISVKSPCIQCNNLTGSAPYEQLSEPTNKRHPVMCCLLYDLIMESADCF